MWKQKSDSFILKGEIKIRPFFFKEKAIEG